MSRWATETRLHRARKRPNPSLAPRAARPLRRNVTCAILGPENTGGTSENRAHRRRSSSVCASVLPFVTLAQDAADWISGFPREPVPVVAWPADRKVAVSFALFVEEFGFGQGPVFRPDLASRSPDLVNEAFRQYAIDWGNARVGRLFKELDVPLTIVLNAEFPGSTLRCGRSFARYSPTRRSSPTA